MNANILDACCGSRMFWFNKQHEQTIFADERTESHVLCDGRTLNIAPDVEYDFRDMPFDDATFNLVVFDPPHLVHLGKSSWMAKKYGVLNSTWKDDIKQAFSECFRVLKPNGVLVFKWNETQITLAEILKLTNEKPLFGNKKPAQSKTHWVLFMKAEA
jgi:ubiquinone/menaquinone biosynthesis C-methylase UbiE